MLNTEILVVILQYSPILQYLLISILFRCPHRGSFYYSSFPTLTQRDMKKLLLILQDHRGGCFLFHFYSAIYHPESEKKFRYFISVTENKINKRNTVKNKTLYSFKKSPFSFPERD